MPKILFASNNIAHFPNSVAGSVVGTFDPKRVPYAISLGNLEMVHSPLFPATTGTETWFHFRTYWTELQYSYGYDMVYAFDAAGTKLFTIKKKANSYSSAPEIILNDGSVISTVSSDLALTQQKINSVDIRYKVESLSILIELYINGSLAGSTSFGANPNALGSPVRFSIGCAFTKDLAGRQTYSEIIVADGDTRNARLDLLRPAAAGTFADWLGSIAVLADDDTTTGMTTIDPLKRQSVTLTPYNGASNISNVVSVSMTTRGQNSPTGLQHSVRMGGVNYDSEVIPVGFPLQYNITDWPINPGTSLPWVGSDLTGLETGFVSVA